MDRWMFALAGSLVACGSGKKSADVLEGRVQEGAKLGDRAQIQAPDRTKGLSAPPEITSESADGFRDFVFYAPKCVPGKGAGWWYVAATGLHHGRKVSLNFTFGPDGKWTKRKVSTLTLSEGYGAFVPVDASSADFLSVMAMQYGVNLPKVFNPTFVNVICLEGDPESPTKIPLKMKIFFGEGEHKPGYAEAYVNIDLQKHRLEFREKDPKYRAAIVSSFGKGDAKS